MWHRWEIADIALFVILRRSGHLQMRKVALLQTKRLYSREIDVPDLERADFEIGIGRIADRTDPLRPISTQRKFTFDDDCAYGAVRAGDHQIEAINSYFEEQGIPIYYGFYNPTALPYSAMYPASDGTAPMAKNAVGFRVSPSTAVHDAVSKLQAGHAPSPNDLRLRPAIDPGDSDSERGWRLERFVADEVLRCRQGRLFEDASDARLRNLLYARSAPIQSAISITIDQAD